MVRVAPINLQYNPRTLWFDPGELDVKKGDPVVVLTARGVEFGRAAGDVFEVEQSEIKKLKSSLKPVKRIATEKDEEKAAEMTRKSAEALPVFKEMAAETNEDMRPVSVEYLLEGDKAVFYFESEDRVDFRDLVRKLASRFHVRIDMRQIGVRDEARMVGGYGHCGQELCCRRLGEGFCPVSIRMAKEQDLSLNPQKISGVCGRLMCCLRYEFDAYKEFKSRAPKQNATVQTPDGPAKVVDLDVPREIVSLKIEGETAVKVPLADLETKGDSVRPNYIGGEAWARANAQSAAPLAQSSMFATSLFTNEDKLAQAGSVRHTGGKSGRGSASSASDGKSEPRAKQESSRKPRRRSTKVNAGAQSSQGPQNVQSVQGAASGQKSQGAPKKKRTDKKGQQNARASEEAKRQGQRRGASSGDRKGVEPAASRRGAQAEGKGSSQRRARTQQAVRGADAPASAQGSLGASARPTAGPRPGQKSSGLRQRRASQPGAQEPSRAPRRTSTFNATGKASAPAATRGDAARSGGKHAESGAQARTAQNDRRRTRRRSHKAGEASASLRHGEQGNAPGDGKRAGSEE